MPKAPKPNDEKPVVAPEAAPVVSNEPEVTDQTPKPVVEQPVDTAPAAPQYRIVQGWEK